MPLRPGETIENYRVVRPIGGGSSAEVFEVEHLTLGSRHALKVLNRQWVENSDLRARFLAEGKLQAGFRSPRLVRVTDTLATPGVAALVMDLLEGECLRDHLEREPVVAVETAVRWARQTLEGLAVAHELGVVHRDVKPENLFLESTTPGPNIRVIDFGIAKGIDGNRTTQRGAMGTCAYMSPEQVRDAASVDARTDLFAVGAVLWEMVAGRPAFEGPTPYASMEAVVHSDPGPVGVLQAGIPLWLDHVLTKALAKDPDARFADADAFIAALDAQDAGVPAPVEPTLAPTPPAPRHTWLRFLAVGLLGAVVLAVLTLTVGTALIYVYRPPTIHALQASSDPCGRTQITLDARARNAPVTLSVDDRPVHHQPSLQGRDTVQATVELRPGQDATVRAEVGATTEVREIHVEGSPTTVAFNLPTGALAGEVEGVSATVSGSCTPPGLTYDGVLAGKTVHGDVTVGVPIAFDLQALPPGRHVLELRVLHDEAIVAVTHGTLFVGEQPPADDQDMDGVKVGDDCNDHDPLVSPNLPEQPIPNGVDDNCDGRVDEGTTAYDDDGDGLSEQDGDCNDNDPTVRPGAPELADCRDQDCDGTIDEGKRLRTRPDGYGDNRTRDAAHDLKTSGKKSFTEDLDLVFQSVNDEKWFRFYSDDGTWDEWGIDVEGVTLPDSSTFDVQVIHEDRGSATTNTLKTDGDRVNVRGKFLRADSGFYLLHVRPTALYRPWCPATLQLRSR